MPPIIGTSYAATMVEPIPPEYPKCELCNRDWHGTEKSGCPGSFTRFGDSCNASRKSRRK